MSMLPICENACPYYRYVALDTRCWQLFSQLLISQATFVGEGNFPQLSLLLATNSATFSDKIKKDVIRIRNGVKRRLGTSLRLCLFALLTASQLTRQIPAFSKISTRRQSCTTGNANVSEKNHTTLSYFPCRKRTVSDSACK